MKKLLPGTTTQSLVGPVTQRRARRSVMSQVSLLHNVYIGQLFPSLLSEVRRILKSDKCWRNKAKFVAGRANIGANNNKGWFCTYIQHIFAPARSVERKIEKMNFRESQTLNLWFSLKYSPVVTSPLLTTGQSPSLYGRISSDRTKADFDIIIFNFWGYAHFKVLSNKNTNYFWKYMCTQICGCLRIDDITILLFYMPSETLPMYI